MEGEQDMKAAWKMVIFMTLILMVGFSIATSANHFPGSINDGSFAYKLKSADIYVEKLFRDVYNRLN